MWMPRFSLVITSYNQREFIKDAVDPALSLPNPEKEIIVVDDGSADGTQAMLRQYGEAIRLVCFETHQGSGAARNCGANLANGEYLVFLDGDDAFLPWALEVYERIVQAKKPKMILGRLWEFKGMLPVPQPEDTPHEIQIVEYPDYLRKDRPSATSASVLVMERQSFQGTQGWSRDIWPANDLDFALRVGVCGRTVKILAPPTTFYRFHVANTSKTIPPYIPSLCKIIHNERAGEYPGGKGRSWERRAIIGRQVIFQAKRAATAGLYGASLMLLARGWTMACVAVARWLGAALKGRQPRETLKM